MDSSTCLQVRGNSDSNRHLASAMKAKTYIGLDRDAHKVVPFRSARPPRGTTHGNRFVFAIGPFRTTKAARYLSANFSQIPLGQRTVEDAEAAVAGRS